MTIKVYTTFSKRKNSTKQPAGGTDVTVKLKTPTSILNPVFEISATYASYKYVYVSSWNRYYYVTDVIYITNDIVEMYCTCDIMASHKTEIGSYNAYVLRSSYSYDLMLHDDELSQGQEYVQDISGSRTTILASTVKQGAYVLRTVGYSGINSFLATEGDLVSIMQYAYDQNTYTNDWLAFFSDNIAAASVDPFKFIVDVRWIALTDSMISSLIGTRPARRVYLGYFDTNKDLHKVDPIGAYFPTSLIYNTYTVAVPSPYYNDFRDYDPSWAEYEIYVPGCGNHPLNPVAVQDGISIDYAIDILTGEVVAQVYQGTADPDRSLLFETRGGAGAPIQIGQMSANGSGNIIGSLAGKINAMTRASGLLDNIPHSAISAAVGEHSSVIGSVGSRGCIQYNPDAFITKRLLKAKGSPADVVGRPLCQTFQISSLPGFILCKDASLSISGYDSERDVINGYLNNGFYYE